MHIQIVCLLITYIGSEIREESRFRHVITCDISVLSLLSHLDAWIFIPTGDNLNAVITSAIYRQIEKHPYCKEPNKKIWSTIFLFPHVEHCVSKNSSGILLWRCMGLQLGNPGFPRGSLCCDRNIDLMAFAEWLSIA